VKLIPKNKTNFIDNNFSTNITKEKKSNKLYLKNDKNNIKLKLLNPTKKHSRNFSSLKGLSPNSILEKSNNKIFNSNNTNNSFSITTNLKTTMDTNITKTQNIKDKINFKENSSFIDNSKTITFISSSSYGLKKNINPQNKSNKKIKKRPKIKMAKNNTYIFTNTKNNINYNKTDSNILKYSNYKKASQKNNEKMLINNNSFIIPKRINILKNIYNNFLTPIRQNTKIKYRNSLSLNKKINKIERNINVINKEQKNIDNNKIYINRTKLKNIYKLLENKKENIYNKDKIKKENEEIDKIMIKIRKIKEKTVIINNTTKTLKNEYIKNKKEINVIQENINNTLNDKKNVNTMIILLHRRIIDIKKRLEEFDEQNYYIDKSFYELNLKYKDFNIIQK
jgi:hypothetical protein